MAKVQVNLKLDEGIVRAVEELVRKGYFSSKTEAFSRALQLLVRHYKAGELSRRFDEIRKGTEDMPSLTEIVVRSHEEEDEG
ncbi:MAG: ribbon-helix-helix domain-containing protein [Candidatus Jordarchaeales archaeon]